MKCRENRGAIFFLAFAIFLLPQFALAQVCGGDICIGPPPVALSAQHAGVVIEQNFFTPPVIAGAELSAVNGSWDISYLSEWGSDVSAERGFWGIFRGAFGALDGAAQGGINYSFAKSNIDGATSTTVHTSFSLPFFGDPSTPSGRYTILVAEEPAERDAYDADWNFIGMVPYTDNDLIRWFETGGAEGYQPVKYQELVFDYIAGAAQTSCTDNCYSNVLFLPGIKASVLKIGPDTIWPPTVWSDDVPQLALNAAGESVNDVRVAGILNSFYGTPIYAPFSDFMDGLVASGLINEWLPLGYDWRYMPEKILDDGVKTQDGVVDPLAKIEELAANSKSGKVTIVAHSMGGLLGKALIKRLESQGKDNLIDSFVMVGSPQLGTPQAVAALLHGDDEGIAGGFIVRPADARTVSQNIPSVYNLLPSRAYFSAVPDAVIKFSADADFTKAWRDFWGNIINSYGGFLQFMTGEGVARSSPPLELLRVPTVASSALMAAADSFHSAHDSYQVPAHIRVVQVAGWGRPTVKAVEYKTNHLLQSYGTVFTREGDGTVVYPSAISSSADETYFFNLFEQNKTLNSNTQHRDLLNTNTLQNIVSGVIGGENIATTTFIYSSKPQVTDLSDELVVSTHSPVILGAYDASGNFTGVDQNQDLTADVLSVSENIPGSSFLYTSEDQRIFLPANGTYNFVYKSIGSGPTTVAVDSFSGDVSAPVVQFSDIPTTETTSAAFSVSSTAPENTSIAIDTNSDGSADIAVSPDGKQSLSELLTMLKERILPLNIKDKLKQELLKKITSLEKKIELKKQRNAKILAGFKAKISKMEMKGRIASADASELRTLLDLLEAQSDSTALNAEVLVQLKAKIISLNVKTSIKSDLLRRVGKLENKRALTSSLANLTKEITRKAVKGKIPDTDAQMLIDLLGKIESAP